MPQLITDKQYPAKLIARCYKTLERLEAGHIHAKALTFHKWEGSLHKIDVGMCFRLVSRDGGQSWLLLPHERYSKLFKG